MGRTQVVLDSSSSVGAIDRRLFGSFVEHLGRCVYTGIFEPDHPLADANGFRLDVLDLVRELGVTTIRYPGGNFVSSYRWEDGVGPVGERPARLDPAWHSLEPNTFGTDEFVRWCRAAGVEPMMAVNLGTRGAQEAAHLLEYCNHPGGTALSDRRRANGADDPHGIRLWCLGNEMDGPWQIGYRSAEQYGWLARTTAHAMRCIDPTVEIVACGSSGRSMPTFGAWERTVLGFAFDHVDYISAHAYYEEHDGDLASFLASGADMDAFIDGVTEAADEVAAERGSDKRIDISFDEWNVWYLSKASSEGRTDWPMAPRLLEDVYSVADAVVVGDLLVTLLRHADRVRIACLAQLVNAIGPIMTEPGGRAWRQATFHPFALTAREARGASLRVDASGPTHQTNRHGEVPTVNVAAACEPGRLAVFAVNRDVDGVQDLTLDLSRVGRTLAANAVAIFDEDLRAVNTADEPDRIGPRVLEEIRVEPGSIDLALPPASWTMVTVEVA
jgi:alpha-N-arabinofuranosidase